MAVCGCRIQLAGQSLSALWLAAAPTPIITDSYTWSFSSRRHLHWVATASIHRDPIMRDLFETLAAKYGTAAKL